MSSEPAARALSHPWEVLHVLCARSLKECLGVYYGTDPDGGQASDQP